MSQGFFKNIGSNVREGMLSELVDWLCVHNMVTYKDKLMNNLILKDDLTLNYSHDKVVKITLRIDDKDEMPFPFKFGDDIDLAVTFDGVGFDKMKMWGKILPAKVVNISMCNMDIPDWGWMDGVEYLGSLHVNDSKIYDGFTGFLSKVNNMIEIFKCDIQNVNGFPHIGNSLYFNIADCPNLKDVSGLSDNNSKIGTVFIRKCNNISEIGDLSGIIIDNLYVDSSFIELAMNGCGKMFKEVNRKVFISWDTKCSKDSFFKDYYDKVTIINKYICGMYPNIDFRIDL